MEKVKIMLTYIHIVILLSVLKDDEFETGNANKDIRKPDEKHTDAIFTLNTCINWATKYNILSHEILLLQNPRHTVN